MAQTCPCGCGRRVGWTKKGAAAGYVRVTAIITEGPEIIDAACEYAAKAGEQIDPADVAEMRRGLVNAERVRGWLVEHLHGQARPGTTPDLLALSHTLDAFDEWAMGMVESIIETDAELSG